LRSFWGEGTPAGLAKDNGYLERLRVPQKEKKNTGERTAQWGHARKEAQNAFLAQGGIGKSIPFWGSDPLQGSRQGSRDVDLQRGGKNGRKASGSSDLVHQGERHRKDL